MSQELVGLKFLKKNEIINMKCDMGRPFAFISYSHDDYDSLIAMNLFKKLYEQGINIWIDTANMEYEENDWTESATKALMNHNCKFAFFFRSESSLLKEAIATELSTIKKLKHIGPILSIDIWHDNQMNAQTFLDKVLNDGDYEVYKICKNICDIVKPGCKALRLEADFHNDLHELADQMYRLAISHGLFNQNQELNIEDSLVKKAKISSDESITSISNITKQIEKNNISVTPNTRVSEVKNSPKFTTDLFETSKPGLPLHGTYTVKELVSKYDNKTFTAKLYTTVGMRIANHPEYTIEPCKNLCQVLQAFADACIQKSGESYIQMVNAQNSLKKNPVFVPSAETGNYKVHYGALPFLPAWSMNINFNSYGYLKNLEARLTELNINPADAELIFDEEMEHTTTITSSPLPSAGNLHDAMYDWMDSYISHQGGMNGEHPLYQLICNKIPSLLESASSMQKNYYTCKGSCGQGNWAGCPWIAIFNTNITNTTTRGVYIVYLLNAENKTLYLTLDQGMTAIKEEAENLSRFNKQYFKEHGYRGKDNYVLSTLADNAKKIQYLLDLGTFSTEAIASGKAEYDAGCICSKKYTIDTLPSDEELYADLENMLKLYDNYYEYVFKPNN